VGKAAFLLKPVHERLFERLKVSDKLFADETTAPVLDPCRGRTKTGQLFAYSRDDRPWGGMDPTASPISTLQTARPSNRSGIFRARRRHLLDQQRPGSAIGYLAVGQEKGDGRHNPSVRSAGGPPALARAWKMALQIPLADQRWKRL
jgi:hypothetical protein